jgi:acetyl-CoA carboxylase biotin carboxyl carrier protein
MNLDDIKEVLDLVREHDLAEFELERDGLKIRIKKGPSGQFIVQPPAAPSLPAAAAPVAAGPSAATGGAAGGALADGPDVEAVELAVVKSPIVGTFYRAPEPGAPPFVDVGTRVRKGQVLCIIEAMKLMNEIESEYDGEVVNAYVENGKPVQYGERLFAIKVA